MSEFFVGQKVVCVDDSAATHAGPWIAIDASLDGLKKNCVYTVKKYGVEHGTIAVVLEEIVRAIRNCRYNCEGFSPHRFRPLESKAISIFRKIAQDVTEGRKVEFVE